MRDSSLIGRVSPILSKFGWNLHVLRFSSVQPLVYVSNSSCVCIGLPARIPESYISQTPVSFGPYAGPYALENATAEYDLLGNQPATFGIVSSFVASGSQCTAQGYNNEAHLVCVTPNNIASGSRVPPNKIPWKSGAGFLAILGGSTCMAVAAVLGFILALSTRIYVHGKLSRC